MGSSAGDHGGTADAFDCVVIGGAMVDETYAVSNLPAPDGGAFARDVEVNVGGVGANVAVALDRLGRDVALVSRVGDDDRGDRVRRRLADTAIDTTHVAVGDDPTSRSLILRDPDGERSIVTAGESFRNLRLDAAAIETIAEAEVVFLTAYAPEPVATTVLDRFSGRRSGVEGDDPGPIVVFDLSGPVAELLGRGTSPETIHGFANRADCFLVGDVAAASYFGGPQAAIERLEAAVRGRGALALLTHGAAGVTMLAAGHRVAIDAFDVGVVDTTGAGDAFAAGFIDGWLLADAAGSPSAGVRHAAAVAACNCTERSAQGGLPTRPEVERFIRKRREIGG